MNSLSLKSNIKHPIGVYLKIIWELRASVSSLAMWVVLWQQKNGIQCYDEAFAREFFYAAQWTIWKWIQKSRREAAGSIENKDPLAEALSRHWIEDADIFLSQMWWKIWITEKYDDMLRDSSM